MSAPLNTHNQREIDLFKDYLRAVKKWDEENDTLPDFAPVPEIEHVLYHKRRAKAHIEIYEKIYGGKP